MTQGKMNWIEIPATDQNESISFYEKVFGWKIDRNESNPEYPMFYDGAGSGGAFVSFRKPSGDSGIVPSIAVPSIDETLDAVSSNGGKVVKGKTDIVEGKDWFAIFEDPAGNHLALYESFSEG